MGLILPLTITSQMENVRYLFDSINRYLPWTGMLKRNSNWCNGGEDLFLFSAQTGLMPFESKLPIFTSKFSSLQEN